MKAAFVESVHKKVIIDEDNVYQNEPIKTDQITHFNKKSEYDKSNDITLYIIQFFYHNGTTQRQIYLSEADLLDDQVRLICSGGGIEPPPV